MEVELVDPMAAAEKKCEPQCANYFIAYQDCSKRIEGKEDAHCIGQYLDFAKCVDHCVSRARTRCARELSATCPARARG